MISCTAFAAASTVWGCPLMVMVMGSTPCDVWTPPQCVMSCTVRPHRLIGCCMPRGCRMGLQAVAVEPDERVY